MSAAAWAVVGVIVGAGLPALANVWSERRADKRAEAERVDRRAGRLFDARRAAYENFQATARALLEGAWEQFAGLSHAAPPDYDFSDALVRSLGTVRLYATPTTVHRAEALLRTLNDYALGGGRPDLDPVVDQGYQLVDDAITAFSTAARADLGG